MVATLASRGHGVLRWRCPGPRGVTVTTARSVAEPSDRAAFPLLAARSSRSAAAASSAGCGEVRATAWRDLVADLEALGQPELLELAHVGLERLGLALDHLRQLRRGHARMLVDERQGAPRPRLRLVEAREPGADRRDVVGRDLVVEREL